MAQQIDASNGDQSSEIGFTEPCDKLPGEKRQHDVRPHCGHRLGEHLRHIAIVADGLRRDAVGKSGQQKEHQKYWHQRIGPDRHWLAQRRPKIGSVQRPARHLRQRHDDAAGDQKRQERGEDAVAFALVQPVVAADHVVHAGGADLFVNLRGGEAILDKPMGCAPADQREHDRRRRQKIIIAEHGNLVVRIDQPRRVLRQALKQQINSRGQQIGAESRCNSADRRGNADDRRASRAQKHQRRQRRQHDKRRVGRDVRHHADENHRRREQHPRRGQHHDLHHRRQQPAAFRDAHAKHNY